KEMKRLGIQIRQCRASEIITDNGYVKAVRADRLTLECDRVILATGGLSYPKTGSSGDGFGMARSLGHTVTQCTPSLVSLTLDGNIPKRLEGLSLRNIKATMTQNGKKVYDDFGEMLFTEKGVSGPVILSMSAHYDREKPSQISIDLKPALDEATLDKRILRDFEENINRDFVNSIKNLLPSKMIPVIVELSGIEPTKKVNEITRKEREGLVKLLKNLTFDIVGTGGYNEAVVTKCGISVKEITPKTMESKLVGGLYFAGEIIDVDAYTGGFNLQIAWSTAYLAGMAQEW
ncbi:MAG: aminoacetone oxidase family FAD-binding enzyme, partial [Clostridia bacterium]|nr:aminoacetone oxidase family FAD-binding enzyme [Clostridia bacterium]